MIEPKLFNNWGNCKVNTSSPDLQFDYNWWNFANGREKHIDDWMIDWPVAECLARLEQTQWDAKLTKAGTH